VAKLFDDWAEGDGGEERQSADDQDHTDRETDEHPVIGTERTEALGHKHPSRQTPPSASAGIMMPKRPINRSIGADDVVKDVLTGQAAMAEPLLFLAR